MNNLCEWNVSAGIVIIDRRRFSSTYHAGLAVEKQIKVDKIQTVSGLPENGF